MASAPLFYSLLGFRVWGLGSESLLSAVQSTPQADQLVGV